MPPNSDWILVAVKTVLYYYRPMAALLPSRLEDPEESLFQFVAFESGSQKFAVEIHRVQEVLSYRKIASLPEATSLFEGLLELRGALVPVLDFRKRFGREAIVHAETRILVLKIKKKMVGFIVDRVDRVLKIPAEKILATPAMLREQASGLVLAVAHCDEELYMIPDLERILKAPGTISRVEPNSGM